MNILGSTGRICANVGCPSSREGALLNHPVCMVWNVVWNMVCAMSMLSCAWITCRWPSTFDVLIWVFVLESLRRRRRDSEPNSMMLNQTLGCHTWQIDCSAHSPLLGFSNLRITHERLIVSLSSKGRYRCTLACASTRIFLRVYVIYLIYGDQSETVSTINQINYVKWWEYLRRCNIQNNMGSSLWSKQSDYSFMNYSQITETPMTKTIIVTLTFEITYE